MLHLMRLLKSTEEPFKNFLFRAASFKVLDAPLDHDTPLEEAKKRSTLASHVLESLLVKAQSVGGSKSVHRHTVINKKMLVRERLKLLFDKDSPFLEIGAFAGLAMDYGDVTASVSGIGKVHNHYCVVFANDATVKGGTLFPILVEKQVHIQQLALLNNLPCIYLVDSGGAYLPLQADIFPDRNHGGRTFYNEAVLSSKGIPQLSLICGSCTAGGAYCPMMAEEAIILEKSGVMFLGGPPLVKAATGEIVTEQELGGAHLHCSISGCTDYYAETEEEAFEMCRESVLALNLPETSSSRDYKEPLYPSNELHVISGQKVLSRKDVYKIIARISDGSAFKEFKQRFGGNLIAGFAFIHKKLVGILANCGSLSWQDSQKGSHFIQLCSHRSVPLIFLQNSGNQSEHEEQLLEGLKLKERAKMISAHSVANIPKIVINIGGCFGDENFTMCGSSFEPNFMFSWPLAHASTEWIPFEKRIIQCEDTEDNLPTKVFDSESSAFYRASRMQIDSIILPPDTRRILALCLDIISTRTSHVALTNPIQALTRM